MLEGGIKQKVGTSRYKLLYINNKGLLYSTGNDVQYTAMNHGRKEHEKEHTHTHTHTHIGLTESLFCTPVTNTTL